MFKQTALVIYIYKRVLFLPPQKNDQKRIGNKKYLYMKPIFIIILFLLFSSLFAI